MTREAALAAIAHLEAPLGPLCTPEEAEADEHAWAEAQDEGMLDALLDLAAHPPSPAERGALDPEQFEYGLSRVLTLLGLRRPGGLRARAAALLDRPPARATLIEVIGAMRDPAGASLLAPLADEPDLSEEEAVRLACALGEIGGEAAAASLRRLESHPGSAAPRAAREIEIAWESLDRLSRGRHTRR